MAPHTTWQPYTGDADPNADGRLDDAERDDLPESAFALPTQRKLPITDAAHVRAALGRFGQVRGVSDADRALAFANLEKAAKHYGVEVSASDWHALGHRTHGQDHRPG